MRTQNDIEILKRLAARGGRLAVSGGKLWAGAPGGLPADIRAGLIRLEPLLLELVSRAGGRWPGRDGRLW